MITNLGRNIIVLAACWLLVCGTGAYLTFVRQPAELERVQKAEKVARLRQAEVASLLAEEAASAAEAEEAVRRWHARYKLIPPALASPEVVGYINDLTQSGFENFDVSLADVVRKGDHGYYEYSVDGRGYFSSLYKFIWDIENNRRFYRIEDLQLHHIDLIEDDKARGTQRMKVMVSFHFALRAFFSDQAGATANDTLSASVFNEDGLTFGPDQGLPPVPGAVLPAARPATNPFFPLVMEALPPNTYNLVDVEEAEFVAIVGDKALFQDQLGIRSVGVGDEVYLGQITSVDPASGRVVARLNKGGVLDEVERLLHSGETFRQALGPLRLAPSGQ